MLWEKINFKLFKKGIIQRIIILDSGMYQGNTRPYSNFRASKDYWDLLITEEY